MKNLIVLSAIILTSTFAFSQNKNVLEETVTKTTNIKTNKGEQELKEQVQVTQEQDVQLDASDRNKINQDLTTSPVKVTKQETVIEGDSKIILDKKTNFVCEDAKCDFLPTENGFTINSSNKDLNATTYQSTNNKYIVETSNGKGIGYFDGDENFIVEIHDKDNNTVIKRVYKQQPQ
ncbi:hypothetical protein [Galbibacter orientalis]|uniref:hypothetical protein n=1 Tax=Galbibacter orientalis TaxID=453852 RepID=UPI0030808CC2